MTIDIQQLRQAVQGEILKNEPMSLHTSFKIGGPADLLVLPASEQDVAAVLAYAGRWNLPLTVLGNGTNVLVRDKGIRGIVLQLGNALKGFQQEGSKLVFDSGYSLILAAKKAGELGLSGMEFAAGIPGSIGGAVYMNAGAYDGEMSNIVTRVWALTKTGEMQVLDHEQLEFAYRHTSLQNSGRVVLKAELSLQQGDRESVQAKMADFNQRRENKQPLEMPSAGSTFKRPPGFFAGTLIDECGLKGFTVGGAQVSLKHAGFVVNTGHATARDVLGVIAGVQARVLKEKGVHLYPEVLILGEE